MDMQLVGQNTPIQGDERKLWTMFSAGYRELTHNNNYLYLFEAECYLCRLQTAF
jgi:hypothetical protein